MSRECRYICQRAANAIISEVGSYRVSSDALLGINQFLDEFLVQLLQNCQSLDLSRIKASVFNLLPSTLGKNAIVEAELEVKTFTETDVIDYDVYEKMRMIGPPFPTMKCLPLLRDKCFEFCTLADKDDQQSWVPQPECGDLVISPIVAIYVTTVLEHMAEYILTAVAMTAETEDTDYVRIKELFLALVDDIQVGMVFQTMDLRDKMEKRFISNGYISRSSMLPPPLPAPSNRPDQIRNSTTSSVANNGMLGELTFDEMDLNYDDEDETNSSHRPSRLGAHSSFSNYSVAANNNRRPVSMMSHNTSNGTIHTAFSSSSSSNKKAYKVFKNDHQGSGGGGGSGGSPLSSEQPSSSVYDPDAPTMNFEDLIRSGNTMRVSLTPNRLKTIETKDQMIDDPTPSKPAWKRRSSSVPRMSTSSAPSSRPQTPIPSHQRSPSPLVPSSPPQTHGRASVQDNSIVKDNSSTERRASPPARLHETKQSKPNKTDTRFEHPRDAPKPPSLSNTSSPSKAVEKSLPTPNSSTSSRQSKNRPPVPSDLSLPSSSSIASSMKTTSTKTTSSSSSSLELTPPAVNSKLAKSTEAPVDTPPQTSSSATSKTPRAVTPSTTRPTLRRGSLSNRKSRENLRRQREKVEETLQQKAALTTTEDNSAVSSGDDVSSKRRDSTPTKQPPPGSDSQADLPSQEEALTNEPESLPDTGTKRLERPSSYVAKRASMAGRRQSLHESYAINVTEADTTPTTPPVRQISAAGTVGNTIKQLDQAVKQKSSSSSVRQRTSPSSSTASSPSIDAKDDPLNPSSSSRQLSLAPSIQQKSASRKSVVLDKVLQFERAHSLDDVAQRRASSYIPRRERFMYLQRDPNALERSTPKSATSPSSSATQYMVRPGTSAAIAAAAARFAAGVSMATQTDPPPAPPSLVVTDETGNIPSPKATTATMKPTGDDNDDVVSLCGIVDGDEEWFLPEDEWEDIHEQENAVAEWLLGEA